MAAGRKSKYHSHVLPKLILVEAWARDGLRQDQIAKNLGITASTLYEYKKKHSELSEALKKGQEIVDIEVENSLLKRARGYRYDEITREAVPYKTIREVDGQEVEETEYRLTVTKIVTKEVQPDTTAQIFWLKNRKPKIWRDQQHINHGGGVVSKVVDYSHLSDEELEKELERYD